MPDIVDGSQSAFIHGRSIVDNIHLAQELLRKYARKRISPRCTLKVDLQKAYDTVDWDFLKETLNFLNFPCRFIDWIMECVSTTSYSFSLNGHYHGLFFGKRGLRQGDPLSQFLFVIFLEVLSRSLHRMATSSAFAFHLNCKNLHITHLAYADDLLLFSHGDTGSLSLLMNCVRDFGNTAGLRINFLNSNIFMAGIDERTRQDILCITGFNLGTLPVRYLGIPIASGRLCTSNYTILVDNLTEKVNAWPRHTLSYVGKLELIRSVLQGV